MDTNPFNPFVAKSHYDVSIIHFASYVWTQSATSSFCVKEEVPGGGGGGVQCS